MLWGKIPDPVEEMVVGVVVGVVVGAVRWWEQW